MGLVAPPTREVPKPEEVKDFTTRRRPFPSPRVDILRSESSQEGGNDVDIDPTDQQDNPKLEEIIPR
ncbi:unnamed protein product [Microthlaspi erraticum]|uniref:Uncharacterized protein n=1 Tax=Microthlaspi erraticum TaxID=1685480 RepID=A0A6D2L587_9BRAS|nr:unnamed protein product [Microthlaspi erraticum]